MKKLAYVLAAAGLMAVTSCNPEPASHNIDADLSPDSAPPVIFQDDEAVGQGSQTYSAPAAPVDAPEADEEAPAPSAPVVVEEE